MKPPLIQLKLTTNHQMAESLKAQITEDMKAAMRAKEAETLSVIRMLLAAVKQQEIDNRVTLDDAQVLSIINKQIKQRRDAAQQFSDANREDLAIKEKKEIEQLLAYLPTQLSEAEIEAEVKAAISELGVSSMQDMGKVMGTLKAKLEGKADFGVISAKVKAALT